ncbi:hypothetical protein NQ318_011036 [Aromia moschata]|uniref:Transmembrane protein 98 n=1 Tax=Aromia moschata TaxID=1265417 RepID=A0AAV8YUM8_9CUCU|nr:hypothetical protein NQ318_011036 [Aromia moschata]
MSPDYAEMVAAIAFGVLSAIFVSAFVILIVICRRQKLLYKSTYIDAHNETSRPEKQLIEPEKPEVELGEVNLNFDDILTNEQWIDDLNGTNSSLFSDPENLSSAKGISSRVDDMVRSMYPPLDPRLLEARAAALTLAVTHLALIARYECGQKDKSGLYWIDNSLEEMDSHMVFLREASMSQETINKISNILNLNTTFYILLVPSILSSNN